MFTTVVGLPFLGALMVRIPNMLDACPCGGFPWLATLVLSSFTTIDGIVVEGEVFPSPNGAHKMILPYLAKPSHDNVPL